MSKKDKSAEPVDERSSLHDKYRPRTLDKIIGHQDVVSQLRAAIDKNKWPTAIAFFGPPSAGKTTLAYALASTAFEGRPVQNNANPDLFELVGTESKTIEDVRSLVAMAHLRPSRESRRFILIEEAQGLLSNAQAAACALAGLERPRSKQSTWLLTSMSPEKFMESTNGKAIASRCVQYHLQAPGPEELTKYAKRIRKGESMEYMSDDIIELAVQSCDGQMRALANLIQKVQMWAEGQDKTPKKIPEDVLGKVLAAAGGEDDTLILNFMLSVYNGKLSSALKSALNLNDPFQAISKMLTMNTNIMYDTVMDGQRHPKVWMNKACWELKKHLPKHITLADIAFMTTELGNLKSRAMSFGLPESTLLAMFASSLVPKFKSLAKEK